MVTVTAPPIEDGAVWISGHRVRAAGAWTDLKDSLQVAHEPVVDLGNVIVFPGWVNAHCHLDYTDMAGQLLRPRAFPDWIKAILTAKSSWGVEEFKTSWLKGAQQLLQSGTTTVANIESMPEILAEVRSKTPLRLFSFLEMTGVRNQLPGKEIVNKAIALLESLPATRGGLGLSPHAPYSTYPDLLAECAAAAKQGWLLTTHVAESQAEFDMYMYRRGPMFDWLESQRSMKDCGLGSPIGHLARHGLLSPNLLAVHANYAWNDDVRLLASQGVSVAHCPRSHSYFRHRCFPMDEMLNFGVNVCLGTDSLASVTLQRDSPPSLSMSAELRDLHLAHPSLRYRQSIRMASQNGARALGLKGVVGELSPGSLADLAFIPFSGPLTGVEPALVGYSQPVEGTMIGGAWEWLAAPWKDRLGHEQR
ncbi:MAG TPA: amidohydrolase family protein [Candidatus Limnocylindria bacterium]|nr:amidohydrolase family protein [Candidatus Limnocylindria bacterium]